MRPFNAFSPAVVVIAALGQFCLGSPAGADSRPSASFSCAEAGLVDEQIICADPILRQTDRALGQQFAGLIGGTSDRARREAIRADEHDWIIRRNRECGVLRTTKLTEQDTPGYVDCFLAAYDERTGDLDRIKLNPAKDPAEISKPIRHSLFADDQPVVPLPPNVLVHTGVAAVAEDHPVLTWRTDGSLVVLAREASQASAGLVVWRPDQPIQTLSDAIADPEKIERLCAHGDALVLIPKAAAEPATPLQVLGSGRNVQLVRRANMPADLAAACGLNAPRRLIEGGGDGQAIDLGPIAAGDADMADRFVSLRDGRASRPVTPPIRIDRRFPFHAIFLRFDDIFVVSPESRPSPLQPAVERAWAKTNCLPYWTVAASSGVATRACIPFGSYVSRIPEPLPTKAGIFFAAQDEGLFKIVGEAPRAVIQGPVEGAAVSPDGCSIAYAAGRDILVVDACKVTEAAR